ncbi:MAG: hypothetical protein R3A13_12385 [Bdellovibrionota bacterium]
MTTNLSTRSLGFRWLFGAGFVAIALAYTLFNVDLTLTSSDVEIKRAETILTLRGAQTTLPSRVTDDRQLNGFSFEVKESESSQASH